MRELTQDVQVLGAHCEGTDLYVDIYGGPTNLCASVRFTVERARQRRRHLAMLQRWAQLHTPVTLVTSGDSMALVNDRALLRRLTEPA